MCDQKQYTSCLDYCDMVSHGVYSFGFFWFFVFFDCFVVLVFLFSHLFYFLFGALSKESQNIVFFADFLYFPCVFWISLNLLTCILKKRAFHLDVEAMWCKIYCKLQWFLDFILGKQHPCEHPFCLNPHIKPLCFSWNTYLFTIVFRVCISRFSRKMAGFWYLILLLIK